MLSKQQADAMAAFQKWFKSRNRAPIFRLFGYAGTGKTTIAKEIAASVNGTVLFATFTGKAALVLRKKGCYSASTLHSLLYRPHQDDQTGDFVFDLNPLSSLADATLLIIDEVSMVNDALAQDALSFGKPILVLGDPAQLPPVKGEGYFINAEPDFMLTEIHRQAAENPIIRLSMDVREGRTLTPGDYGSCVVVRRGDIDKDSMMAIALEADQILCGMNRTRHAMNRRVRELKGYLGDTPVVGDKLVCLKNNRNKGLLNGGLWSVSASEPMKRHFNPYHQLRVASLDDDKAAPLDVEVLNAFFDGTDDRLHWKDKKKFDDFTYGYALTVHKSQGSQFDNVLLFDESNVFNENRWNHLYTGVTRAAEKLTIVLP